MKKIELPREINSRLKRSLYSHPEPRCSSHVNDFHERAKDCIRNDLLDFPRLDQFHRLEPQDVGHRYCDMALLLIDFHCKPIAYSFAVRLYSLGNGFTVRSEFQQVIIRILPNYYGSAGWRALLYSIIENDVVGPGVYSITSS